MSRPFRSQSRHRPQNSCSSRSNTPSALKQRSENGFPQSVLVNAVSDKEDDDPFGDEELDPRVQVELEKLNACTDEINKYENKLDEANCLFRTLLTDSTQILKSLSTKIGPSIIEKARPYYDALDAANKAQKECQAAATAFQRAFGIHVAAKETIALAEERFLVKSDEWKFDTAWQEMLNHATIKVMAAEKQKTDSEAEHLMRAASYTAAEQQVQAQKKKLSTYISKSRPYFDQKLKFNTALESEKKKIHELQEKVTKLKLQYSGSLRNLEDISESIHARRKLRKLWSHDDVGDREAGVGAELDYDLEVCERNSVRSAASGQSATPRGSSEWDSVEALEAKNDSLSSELTDLMEKLKTMEVGVSMKSVERTSSCPTDISMIDKSNTSPFQSLVPTKKG